MRINRLLSIVVLVICFREVCLSQAAQPTVGLWRGTSQSRRVVDLDWVGITIDYSGSFWFNVGPDGTVNGKATVIYGLAFDDAKLRSLLALGNGVSNSALGLAPDMGAFLGAGAAFTDLTGLKMEWAEPMPTRVGDIKGWLKGSDLHLEWATKPEKIAYNLYNVYATKTKLRKSDTADAYSPWVVNATITELAPGRFVAASPVNRTISTKANVRVTTSWNAHNEVQQK